MEFSNTKIIIDYRSIKYDLPVDTAFLSAQHRDTVLMYSTVLDTASHRSGVVPGTVR